MGEESRSVAGIAALSEPNTPSPLEAGVAHHRARRFAEAAEEYERVLRQQPDHPDALHLLGLVSHQMGQSDRGIHLIRRAIAANPNVAEYHANLAGIYADVRRFGDAADVMQHALALKPDDVRLRARLSACLTQQGIWLIEHDRPADALPPLERAVSLTPDAFDAIANIGIALTRLKRYEEAIPHYQRALALKPDLALIHTNLGAALLPLGRISEAVAAHRRACTLRPGWMPALRNLAIALGQFNQFDEALQRLDEVLRVQPDDAAALFNRGMLRISRGDLPGGWADLEARFRVPEIKNQQTFPQPRWTRNSPAAGTVLVHAEAGLGDTLQFVRYLPEIAARGAKVILQCERSLTRLLAHSFPGVHVVPRGTALPKFDTHLPIMSLPYVFGTTLQTIPQQAPYLAVPPENGAKWQHRLGPRGEEQALRVGVVWAGNPAHYNDLQRSIPCNLLLPTLARVPGVQLFSLQKGSGADQLEAVRKNVDIVDLAPELDDFADTAAAIERLDAVITVDTSIAHLAGALAKAVWMLLPMPSEFRWMHDRVDSPWYPTMRLFRQSSTGDWKSLLENVATELTRFSSASRPAANPRR